MSATTFAEASEYVVSRADNHELDRIIDAVKERRRALRAIVAASVRRGATVQLGGLSPKFLNGLTGEVTAIDGKRATVRLDEESTDRLRYQYSPRYPVADGVTNRVINGVPLECCLPAE